MVPADGEHGAAGICYGAAVGGGRVFNATSAQGLLYSLEELPVQSGTRFPMLLDLATRTVSGPLNIRGDHSDVYFALNTGWLILLRPRPAGRLRPERLRAARRRALGCAAAGDRRVRRLLHEPSEAARRVLRGSRGGAGVPRPVRRDSRGARSAAPRDGRAVHERPRSDQQQVSAQPRDGGGVACAPGGVRRVRGDQRPTLRPRRPVPDGRRRGGAAAAELRRRNGEGRRRPAPRRGRESRCDQSEHAPAVPVRGVARRASRRARPRDRRARRLVRLRWRQRRP